MNTADLARRAYARPDAPQRNLRGIEYDVFARVTRALIEAWNGRELDHPGLVRALHDNSRLWHTLAADLLEPGNALPPDLKARLIYLYEFTTFQTARVRDGQASADVLIDINTAVMRGLRGEGVAA